MFAFWNKNNTYKYTVKINGRSRFRGVTTNLGRRTNEVRERWPDAVLVKVGRKVTRASGLRWANG